MGKEIFFSNKIKNYWLEMTSICHNITTLTNLNITNKCLCAHILYNNGYSQTVIDYANYAYCSYSIYKLLLLIFWSLYLFLILGMSYISFHLFILLYM